MNEPAELTPKEKFHAHLYKDPERMFKRAVLRALVYLIPSIGLMAAWIFTGDPAYAYVGYGILLSVLRLFRVKTGLQTTNKVITKYEQKIQDQNTPPANS